MNEKEKSNFRYSEGSICMTKIFLSTSKEHHSLKAWETGKQNQLVPGIHQNSE